ncbi:hypothetical protein DVH24_004461 [Malus domestica]|uniref:Uncharacterized protein n=1 Tax=Malus domestica TaxID=3750 RepID=A0A498IF27_MALDO|nr:hypothetical protein DVH24_004461 [Malus domestica]
MIEWLYQELKGQTVPSSSVTKLASKSIVVHPIVVAFLKSAKQMDLNGASPLLVMHEEFGFELDLNKLLEKQIEEINISAMKSHKTFQRGDIFYSTLFLHPKNAFQMLKFLMRKID